MVTHQREPEMISKGSKPKVQLNMQEVFEPNPETSAKLWCIPKWYLAFLRFLYLRVFANSHLLCNTIGGGCRRGHSHLIHLINEEPEVRRLGVHGMAGTTRAGFSTVFSGFFAQCPMLGVLHYGNQCSLKSRTWGRLECGSFFGKWS